MVIRNLQARWIIGLILLIPSLSLAATYYVDGDVANSGNGTSWAKAFKTIQEAVDASARYDVIWVKMGTYTLSAEITVDKGVYIYGGFDGSETRLEQRDWKTNVTTVDGNDTVRGFYIQENVGIDGFTITNGKADQGGGIYVNNVFTVSIANCVFDSNSVTDDGGGIYNYNAYMTIENSSFFDNTAAGNGGGISSGDAHLTIENSSFFNNIATENGGGIYNSSTSPSITNSLFYDNSASSGGGIYNDISNPTIMNCTFARNGGGIYNGWSSPIITNSIVWGNSNHQIGNTWSYPSVTYSDIEGGYEGEGNIDADPLFENAQPPGKPDFHLKAGSPAIDAGTADGAPDTDLDGNSRPNGQGYDMGAYEHQSVSQLQFSQADYSVSEDDGNITLTVTRKGSSDGKVSVKYATSNDTAKAGSDYDQSSGKLSWNDGDTGDKTFTVSILDDTKAEGNETFIVSLGKTTGDVVLGSPDTAVVTIIDDEEGGKSIQGCVELDGSPVTKAQVLIKQKGEKKQKTNTDDDGCYKFDKTASGKKLKIIINVPEVP
jgi:predicted outer membrane repeat protein